MTRRVNGGKRTSRGAVAAVTVLAGVLTLAAPRQGGAECDTTDGPPNVILLLADDLGWNELPFYGAAIEYKLATNQKPTDLPEERIDEYSLAHSTHNRLAARLLAQPYELDQMGEVIPATLGAFQPPALFPDGPVIPEFTVIPFDLAPDSSTSFVYAEPAKPAEPNGNPCESPDPDDYDLDGPCYPRVDILRGHGGLKRLADLGFVMSGFYATSAYCSPTRASIMTGRHTHRHKVSANGARPIGADEVTIAEYLKQGCREVLPDGSLGGFPHCFGEVINDVCQGTNGEEAPCYATGLIGKWHGGTSKKTIPYAQGFDEFLGHKSSHRGYMSEKDLLCSPTPDGQPLYVGDVPNPSSLQAGPFACAEMTEVPGAPDPGGMCCSDDNKLVVDGTKDKPGEYLCSITTDDSCVFSPRLYRKLAIDFIKRHKNHPFFLVLSMNTVHNSHIAPQRTRRHYTTASKKPRFRSDSYYGLIEEMDASIGEILESIKGEGLTNKTVILFTSDHGSPHADYGMPALRGGKGNVFEGGIRVGMLGTVCGQPSGVLAGDLGSQVDLYATIAEAAGYPVETAGELKSCQFGKDAGEPCETGETCDKGVCKKHYVDGKSLLNRMKGDTPASPRDLVYARYGENTVVAREGAIADGMERVCGRAFRNVNNIPIHAGSCTTCDDSYDCDLEPCRIGGSVCVPDSGSGSCERAPTEPIDLNGTGCHDDDECDGGFCVFAPVPPQPEVGKYTRCLSDNDCEDDWTCAQVSVRCDDCVTTSWKMMVHESSPCGPEEGPVSGAALYDLSTNPTEDDRLNCNDVPAFSDLSCTLGDMLDRWDACSARDEDPGCEPTGPTPTPEL